MKRDYLVRLRLYNDKIKCLIIWECTIKNMKKDIEKEREIIAQTKEFLENDKLVLEF